MEAHVAVAHLALNLRPGYQGRHAVHHNDVNGPGAHQGLRNFQGLLAGVRLGDQHVLYLYPQSVGIGGVQSVLRVHEGHLASLLLGLGHHMEGQGGLAGGLRPVDLDDAPLGEPADAKSHVQGQGACGDDLHIQGRPVPQAHNGALAVHFFNLAHGAVDGFFLVRRRSRGGQGRFILCHADFLPNSYIDNL